MSSKNDHEQRTPYVQRINLSNMRSRSKPQKLCPDCTKEMNDCNKIEKVIDNFHENPIKQNKVNQFSIFNAKFTLNKELEYIFRNLHYFEIVNVYQKIRIDSGGKRIKKKPPKHCQNCKETNDCVKLFLNKTNRLEGIVGNFRKNPPKKTNKISVFRAKFTLNSVPCELEYDLSCFTLESLQKLADFTTQNFNNKKNSALCELENVSH
ncbi:unnamed protein product [Rhizophagus irregularis]|uniref:Uncharacterized protein n=1 Tax=Rhizophagus irregularis TaxID=588596 RepID=A0A915ZQF0_9GLOM|nr:unnamed protein product [Rhizophagus irregularis]CAB5383240.1 unnamed protein product [Rhizophagus irregularis]